MKKIIGIYTSPRAHWVGDGFPVRTLFSYDTMGKQMSHSTGRFILAASSSQQEALDGIDGQDEVVNVARDRHAEQPW